MRRAIIVTAIVCTSVACGGLLGFGDDDDEPGSSPPPDAASDAFGQSEIDAARVCEKVSDDFNAYATQTDLVDTGWLRFFGAPDCGLLGFDGGAFVAERPAPPVVEAGGGGGGGGGTACSSPNMGIFRSFEAGVRTMECSFDVTVNSFDGTGDFFEIRVEGTTFKTYRVSGGFNSTLGTRSRVLANLPDGAVVRDEFQYDAALPTPGLSFRVHAKLDLAGKPTFTWTRDDGQPAFQGELPDPGVPPLVQLYLGVTDTNGPRAVTIDNVTCEACQ